LSISLAADGHSFSSLVANYTLNQLEGATPAGNGSHPAASGLESIAGSLGDQPGVHAVEQGSAIAVPGSFSSSDDGGY